MFSKVTKGYAKAKTDHAYRQQHYVPPPPIITKLPNSPPQQETNHVAMVAVRSVLEKKCSNNQHAFILFAFGTFVFLGP